MNAYSYSQLAQGLSYIGMYDSAEVIMKRGVEVDPNSTNGHLILANIFIEQQIEDKAVEMMDQILAIDSANIYKLNNAANSLQLDSSISRRFLSMVSNLESSFGKEDWMACSIQGYLIRDADSAQVWIDEGIQHYESVLNEGRLGLGQDTELLALYSLDNQLEKAISLLITMFEKRGFLQSVKLRNDPRFSNLRKDPTIDSIIQVMDKSREEMRMMISSMTPPLK